MSAIVALGIASYHGLTRGAPPVSPPRPPSSQEWAAFATRARAASVRYDFAAAEKIYVEAYTRCLSALGPNHPDTAIVAENVRLYRSLQRVDKAIGMRAADARAIHGRVAGQTTQLAEAVLPEAESICAVIASAHRVSDDFATTLPSVAVHRGQCNAHIAFACSYARMFEAATAFGRSACQGYRASKGTAAPAKTVELLFSVMLREQGKAPVEQVALLKGIIDFCDQYQVTDRLVWRKERAMTQLAETYYRQGNRQEADRLYAEVRSRLPEDSDHDLVGWCKSWCDRHEARQLMEKGDWDAAYEKIFQARVGTIDYGHRNLSKGLTMERILRMSAEIQRKRGNNKEADEDQEYADLIARHAAKLRTAVEAELQKLRESEANTTPQPAP